MRKCARCGEEKPVDEFRWKNEAKGWRASYCTRCAAATSRANYVANRSRYLEATRVRNRLRRVERTAFLIEYFKTHRCVDCGESDPVVLDFDHLRDKEFNIGQELESRNWDVVLAEITKCEVVCANCHSRRTRSRNGSLRASVVLGQVTAE